MRRTHVKQPTVTGDAALRLERLSANTSSTTWFDITASGNNGTANDAALFADFDFDGVVDNVQVTSTTSCNDMSQDWTITLWYQRNTTGNDRSTIFDTRNASIGGFTVRDNIAGPYDDFDLQWYPANLRSDILDGTDANWHFGVILWESGVGLTTYVDGALKFTVADATIYASGLAPRLGRGNFLYYLGKLDTFRVYPRLLSVDEIVRDYHAGKPVHP